MCAEKAKSGKSEKAKPRGTILLLALLVMSGMLITGASLGTISVLTLRQSRVIDDSVAAFAAAESGAEQTLYQLRRAGTSIADITANPNHDSNAAYSGPAMTGGVRWSRQVAGGENTVFVDIPKDSVYELVLWNPDAPTVQPDIETLTYLWDDVCGGLSGLEVLAVGWNPAAGGTSPFSADVDSHGNSPALTFLRDPGGIIDNAFIGSRAYRVRLRAKVCDIRNLAITARKGDGTIVSIPSRIAVTSTGEYVSARQSVELRLPRLLPLSGAFDFIIFSQCSILKGLTGGPPC